MNVTFPETIAVLGFSVTVAVSVAEPPKVMGVGETFVVIDEPMTTRVSLAALHPLKAGPPFCWAAGL